MKSKSLYKIKKTELHFLSNLCKKSCIEEGAVVNCEIVLLHVKILDLSFKRGFLLFIIIVSRLNVPIFHT